MTTTPTLASIANDFATWLPTELVSPLIDAYREVKENYYLGRHEPAELNAGKLCEVLFRILEHECGNIPTPLGVSIRPFDARCRAFESKTQANESIRFHLPRLAIAIYDIRNKRGVGHVGGDVNPNFADATLVSTVADWVMAELIRLHYHCTLNEAQHWVSGLVQRKILLVYEIDGNKRVLNPTLSHTNRTLLILASEFPQGLSESTLFSWTEHSNSAVFRRDILRPLHKKKFIEYQLDKCTILPPGLSFVEENYAEWSVTRLSSARKSAKRRRR